MKKLNGSKFLLIIIVLSIIAFILIFYLKDDDLETEAINLVKKYIKENNIVVNENKYIKLDNLDKNNKFANCQRGSGVFISQDNYYAVLYCQGYKTIINDNQDFLKGTEIIFLNTYEDYIELGYNSNNLAIISEKKVDDLTIISYIMNDKIYYRYVIYTNDKGININGLLNNEFPTLTLVGNSEMELYLNSSFVEPGYSAFDNNDGELTNSIITNGEVDVNTKGEYYISYYVQNSKGNYAFAKRKVVVKNKKVDFTTKIYLENSNIINKTNIHLSINGEGVNYVVLPNDEISNLKEVIYPVSKNGVYSFKIIDANNNTKTETINVTNIDDVPPTGNCAAIVESNKVTINVNGSDQYGIKNYKYIVNNNEYISNNNSYVYNGLFNKKNMPNVVVELVDNAVNVSSLTCSIIDNTLKVVNDVNGNQCLSGFVCYKQADYSDMYQATASGPGPIYQTGCLPTSLAIISTYFNKKSLNGQLYTPSTLVKEIIYNNGGIWGYSTYERVVYVADKLNLKVSKQYNMISDIDIFKSELKKGNVIIINTNSSCFSPGAHYLTVIGINEKNEIFISDPFRKSTQSYKAVGGKYCTVNAWSNIDELVKLGGVTYFSVISD